jgi:tRNA-splicing ligase RtcB
MTRISSLQVFQNSMYKINDKAISWVPIEEIEVDALKQIENTSKMPFLFKHVAVMPDCHFGKGATVGTVLATKGAIIPAAVGVDIGCGMIAVKTNKKIGDLKDLAKMREGIERRIPMSAGKFNTTITESAAARIKILDEKFRDTDPDKHKESVESSGNGMFWYDSFSKNWREQLGTLGGGNHFIEICVDEEDTVWATLHSGSRGIGNKIGNWYIEAAKDIMRKYFIELTDLDLAYIPEHEALFSEYIRDVAWAQHFALLNREEMMDRVMTELSYHFYGENGHQAEIEVERINCHHNFAQFEEHFGQKVWVTRKGAIHAGEGMRGMIPGSMGARSYIIEGLANKMAFESSPHGAGRRMSRGAAKKAFNMDDLAKAMVGIEYRVSDVLIDEIPGAYKDIDKVMEYAKDLVKITHTLRQLVNVKGD